MSRSDERPTPTPAEADDQAGQPEEPSTVADLEEEDLEDVSGGWSGNPQDP